MRHKHEAEHHHGRVERRSRRRTRRLRASRPGRGRACGRVASRSILALTDEEVTAAIQQVRERGFAVSALATPIFKCSLPDAPAPAGELHGAAATATIEDSWRLLARALEIGAEFEIPVIRAFSFWRVAEPAVVFEQVVEALREALVLRARHRRPARARERARLQLRRPLRRRRRCSSDCRSCA